MLFCFCCWSYSLFCSPERKLSLIEILLVFLDSTSRRQPLPVFSKLFVFFVYKKCLLFSPEREISSQIHLVLEPHTPDPRLPVGARCVGSFPAMNDPQSGPASPGKDWVGCTIHRRWPNAILGPVHAGRTEDKWKLGSCWSGGCFSQLRRAWDPRQRRAGGACTTNRESSAARLPAEASCHPSCCLWSLRPSTGLRFPVYNLSSPSPPPLFQIHQTPLFSPHPLNLCHLYQFVHTTQPPALATKCH